MFLNLGRSCAFVRPAGFFSDFRSARRLALDSPLVFALFIRTRNHRSIFADSLHQVLMSTIRALLGDGLGRRSELALRIVSASIKRVALARALFDQFAFLA